MIETGRGSEQVRTEEEDELVIARPSAASVTRLRFVI